jgi:small GTP-binding protein
VYISYNGWRKNNALEEEKRMVRKAKSLSMKLCLVGDGGVGKTSLIRRFVYDDFDDRYIITMGTKVTKKELKIQAPNGNGTIDVTLLIWDIIGQRGFRQLLKEAYFYGTNGIIGTCDVTRQKTLKDLVSWNDMVQCISKETPIVFLGNKSDLTDDQVLDLGDIKDLASQYENSDAFFSSAKTGDNVELAFKIISERMAKEALSEH